MVATRLDINKSLDCANLMKTCKIQAMAKCKQAQAKVKGHKGVHNST
jgi:hypothetical protein